MFESEGNPASLASETLITALHAMQDSIWAEWRGKGLTKHGLAKLLKPFNAKPRQWREGPSQIRGYHRADLEPIFERYAQPRGA